MKAVEITIAGFGGQGILLMGQLLAYAASKSGKNVSWLPSYGPEMRGGTANCMVVISDSPINSPLVLKPHILIAMNKPSLDRFEPLIRENGMLLINRDMIDRNAKRTDLTVAEVKADSIAEELGNNKVANIVALGAFVGASKIVELDVVKACLDKVLPAHRKDMFAINEKALLAGFEKGSQAQQKGGAVKC